MKRNRCDRCGEDLTTYKKLIMLSNRYYNEGLEKAKVRDLSGAVLVLKQSLEINKRNTNARNLLGLVYYEMGEMVSALSEWVVSKHFQSDGNEADEYINDLQANPTKLDSLNQTIKKYNYALSQAKQGSDDLAIIQLKKVVSLNPRFVKALQLLALLYMKNGEYEKAIKNLNKASKVDVSNTTTLRYLKEIEELTGGIKGKEEAKEVINTGLSKDVGIFPKTSYKEDKPNIWVYINLILGAIVGVGVVFALVVPTIQRNHVNEQRRLESEYNENLNKVKYSITQLEREKEELEEEVKSVKAALDGIEIIEYDETIYDSLFHAAAVYSTELEKTNKNDVDYIAIAKALRKVKEDKLERQGAKELYNKIKAASYLTASGELYSEGHKLYSQGKYEESLETLLEAYEYDAENVNTIYFVGRSYHQLRDYENAKKYYEILTTDFPDTSRANEAKSRLNGLQ